MYMGWNLGCRPESKTNVNLVRSYETELIL